MPNARGEVEGAGESDNERREVSEFEDQAVELRGAEAAFDLGGHGEDAPDDGYQPDQDERLGHYFSVREVAARGATQRCC